MTHSLPKLSEAVWILQGGAVIPRDIRLGTALKRLQQRPGAAIGCCCMLHLISMPASPLAC